jgi:hypothetical protein
MRPKMLSSDTPFPPTRPATHKRDCFVVLGHLACYFKAFGQCRRPLLHLESAWVQAAKLLAARLQGCRLQGCELQG